MPIDLRDIVDEPAAIEERFEVPLDRLDPAQMAGAVTVRLSGTIHPDGDEHHAHGTIVMSGSLLCTRCLAPTPWQAEETFSATYRESDRDIDAEELELDEGDLDVVFLDGNLLDLMDLAAEQIALAAPMRALCREDCAGLCPRCGANRNAEGACRCEPEVDPRWEALKGLSGRPS